MKKATVVIPNWNGLKYLKACFDSLMEQDTDEFDILMIDNASQDDSVSFVRENYPSVRVEIMDHNLGFSGGVNEGIVRSETPYVLLLNNDVEVDRHFVKGLIEAIEKDPRIFSVSSRMVNFYDRSLMDDAGDMYTIVGFQAQRGVGQKVTDPKYAKPASIFSACAGAAIYRKSIFDEIGLFDLDHFAYLEDIDVGYRALIYGYKNVYEPSAICYHVGSGASGAVKYSDFKVRISARNNIYLCYKNMPALQRFINYLPLLLGRKVKRNFFEKEGFGQAYDDGIREGYEKRKTTKKVPFRMKHLPNYIKIEFLLVKNIFVYYAEYKRRHR